MWRSLHLLEVRLVLLLLLGLRGAVGSIGSVLTIFNSITVGGITLEGTYVG